MKTITLYRDIKLKSGEILKKGTEVNVYPDKGYLQGCTFTYLGKEYVVRWNDVVPMPSSEQLEAMFNEDEFESVFGCRVEPDGYDRYGGPSWLLVLGMI